MAVNSFREDEQIKSTDAKKIIKRLFGYLKEYKVCDKNKELWGKNIASYNGGDQELAIGDHVIWFSYENNVGYIVKD